MTKRDMTTRLSATLALLTLLVPAVTHADAHELAKRHFKLGEEMFNRADYAGAMAQFEAAYKHSKKPALLYNIARCQESLGRHEDAIKTYERYLALQPRDADRIKARIDNLRELVRQKHGTTPPTPAPAPAPAPAPSPPSPETTAAPAEDESEAEPASEEKTEKTEKTGGHYALWGWITAGAGAALLVTGGVLGAMAAAKSTEMEEGYRDGKEYSDLKGTEDAGASLETGQIITLVAGGVALAAGGVLLYLHYGRRGKGKRDDAGEEDLSSIWVAPMATQSGAYLGGGFAF